MFEIFRRRDLRFTCKVLQEEKNTDDDDNTDSENEYDDD